MSVRDGLLAILSLGPAYGLQLHSEFSARAAHRPSLNVGQVYSTLDRAMVAGLVQSAGVTDDALPLTRLTDSGRRRAAEWMSTPVAGPPLWEEMLDQVLITSTISPHLIGELVEHYRRAWADTVTPSTTPAELANRKLAEAAESWLAEVGHGLAQRDSLPLSTARPRRGRRPSGVASNAVTSPDRSHRPSRQ